MIKYFRLFSDETRLRLLRLCDAEELNVDELTRILGMAQPRISNHLKLLRDAGLLAGRREGTWAYYRMPAAAALPPEARLLWDEAKAWMKEAKFQSGDLERREQALRERAAPAARYFDAIGARWDDIGSRLMDEPARMALLLALVPGGLTAADVGCGAGKFLGLLSPLAHKVIGVEPSPKMLAAARRSARSNGWKNVELRKGGLDDLPLKDGEADAVFCTLVLHHAPRPAEAIAAMARALKPGGKLVICDFSAHALEWLREDMADFWLGFEPGALVKWMAEAGLDSIRSTSLGKSAIRRTDGKEPVEIATLMAVGTRTGIHR